MLVLASSSSCLHGNLEALLSAKIQSVAFPINLKYCVALCRKFTCFFKWLDIHYTSMDSENLSAALIRKNLDILTI